MSLYVITAIGIPVYYHYCGGELEEINYVMKGSSCCGREEDDSGDADNGCCKDEHFILKSNTDFTLKELNAHALVKTFHDLFFITLPFSAPELLNYTVTHTFPESPPPQLQHALVISTSVLRI